MKNKIMFGVYLMFIVRKLKSPFVAEVGIFALLALILSGLVSIPSIISNMADSVNFYRYFMIAFSSTNFLVQSLVIVFGVVLIFSLRNFVNILELSRSNSVGRVTHS